MTGDASAGARDESDEGAGNPPADVSDHEAMLSVLDTAIGEAQRKIESGRVYDAENEKVRIKWIRCLAYAINVRRQVVQDRDLEELTEEVERIKEMKGVDQ